MSNRNGRWVLPVSVIAVASFGVAGEIGYVEDFALARDRAASLRQLIPGTEDYYFYHSLHLLNTEQFEKLDAQIAPWLERFGQTQRLTEVQTRAALLTYDRNPKRTLEFLRDKLGLRFDHQRNIPGAVPQLPTTLDPSIISRATLKSHSLTRWTNLDNFEESALDWLAADTLDWERRRNLLQRLTRPDVPNLPRLVAEDLRSPRAAPFGSMAIHKQLTLEQMEELARLQPALLGQQAFVHSWIARLRPGADDDWRHDSKLARAYSDRLLHFVRKLSPAHNSLKANVIYHRLVLDRSLGTYDSALFLEYLQLPRQQPYMSKIMLEGDAGRRFAADLNADFSAAMPFAPVRGDESLVRSFLLHFLTAADAPREFEPYINDEYLRAVFAEAKITAGLGDADRWASQLSPEAFRQLKERVDIDFAFTNPTWFAASEPVRLDVHLKNVSTLVIKVFEINTVNYYRTHQRDISTDINLDGLTANAERTHASAEPPLRRISKRFEFPELTKPGVYVVDFIGGGKSSRALIRKGMLRPLVATGTAGLSVTVVDDANAPVPDARIWLGGQEFSPVDGRIIVPFSTAPGRRPIVISRGDFSCLSHIEHPAEQYSLVAGIHVDREALLARRVARLIVRPGLFLNGKPVSLQILENVRLQLTSTDRDGIQTSSTISNFQVFEDRESTHDFRTPPRLARLDVVLLAQVKNLSQANKNDVVASQQFLLNEIDGTDKTECLHLARFGPDYVIEVRGRTGEVRPDRAVNLAFKHRDFKEPAHANLKSDARGRIVLGPLPDITAVTATGQDGVARRWPILRDHATQPPAVHARSGATIALPWTGAVPVTREEAALFETRGDTVRSDQFAALSARDGRLELRGLAPGDYLLWLKRDREPIRVRIVDGPVVAGHVLGRVRHLALDALKPMQIAGVAPDGDNLVVRLTDASKLARVHVFAARYRPAFSSFADLAKVRAPALEGVFPAHAESNFLTGRNIGDELRYVLDRRMQKLFPGNMLQRPELLLNPWAVRSTETGEQIASGGDNFKPSAPPAPTTAVPSPDAAEAGAVGKGGEYANLDFLADAAAVLTNLVPDESGTVRVPRSQLGPHAIIHVVAVDPLHTISRTVALPEQPASALDLRLTAGLDPKNHFTQQKQITLLAPKETFALADALSGRFEAYNTLTRVFTLFATLHPEPKLAEFRFVLEWPKLKIEDKRSQYSKYACHELNFFLFKKDPEFFRAVVRPHLANKKDKTFLDRWLLEEDLAEFLRPWQFDRLNAVERVLLAQRVAGEAPRVARHFSDRLRLQPPNVDRHRALFETAILGASLDADDKTRLGQMKEKARQELKYDLEKKDGPAGGRFGGGAGGAQGSARGEAKSEMERMRRGAVAPGAAPAGRPANMPPARDGSAGFKSDLREPLLDNARKTAELRQLYRRVPPTQEWAENNYYHLPIQQQVADVIPLGQFWQDYLKHAGPAPFLSKNLAEAARSFTEAMFALAVLDLPFDGDNAVVKYDGNRMSYTPAGPAVAFHEEIRPVGGPAPVVQILVSQNFYRHGDRFRDEDGERFDKFVTGEFIAQTVYGCQVVITNPTSSRQRLTALLQIPVGSIPLAGFPETKSVALDLEPYRTQTLDYLFYFPLPGRFAHFPVHVAKNEALVASTPPATFEVVDKPSKLDTTSWEYVSQNGTADDVLGFLGRENTSALDLDKIAFRMKDKAFFERTLALLRERHVYQPTLWSYSIYLDVPAAIREFLAHSDALAALCGGPIDCALVVYDPVARHTFEHLEYKPLVNARAHALGHRRQIVNDRFREQYDRFLHLLSYRKQLTDADLMAVTYDLLLQDRIAEALETFGRINPERVPTRMQYDYCAAYLAMFGPSPQTARSLAAKYADYPVDRWRHAFAEIVNHLDEAEGKAMQIANADDRNQKQGQMAATEPTFEVIIENQAAQLRWQNLKSARVNYYLMDVEVLFSRSPFAQDFGGQFSTIRPNATLEIPLPVGQSRMTLPLPKDLARRNVLVEVVAAGKSRSAPYYANAMDVQVTENYGQMRIAGAEGKPIPKVYVKVYARLANGEVKFHKDGYTDLRGRFDYASVSTPEKSPITRFAILALSDERGALIREAAPPPQ